MLVHAAVWGGAGTSGGKPWATSLAFTGTSVAFVAAMSVVDQVHAMGDGLRLVTAVAVTAIPFGIWPAVSSQLPRLGVGWKGLIPGALMVGIGAQAFHRFAIWFLAPKLANATQLYGSSESRPPPCSGSTSLAG